MTPQKRILLINMPFASLATPSIALTQLRKVLEQKLGDRVSIEILYLNHDFAHYIGELDQYNAVLSNYGFMSGAGDWFFRNSAFPEEDDNTDEYLARYFSMEGEPFEAIRRLMETRREGIYTFLDTLIEKYDIASADIVGFTALFSQTVASFAMARRLKAMNPDILTVIGGAACEGEMGREFAKQVPHIDYFFSGPGLVSFPAFVQNILDGKTDPPPVLNGVFAGHDRRDGVKDPTKIVGDDLDIDNNIILDYDSFLDSFEESFPNGELEPHLLFETSRGCWWGERLPCAFCGLNGLLMGYRAMSADNAAAQIESMFRYAARCSFFESVDNVVPGNYLRDVFPRIHPPPGTKIQYEVRSDLKEEDLRTLCASGVTVIQPGIESLSTPTLKLMRKGTSAFSNIRFLKDCSKYPVSLGWNLLIFTPGEPVDTFEKYLRYIPLLTHLHPPLSACCIGFVQFSHYFENPGKYNLDLHPEDFYGMVFPFEEDALRNIAYKFFDANADMDLVNEWLEKLNAQISWWRARWLNQDGGQESRLCYVQDIDEHVIYDTRGGEIVEHVVNDVTKRVLDVLEAPLKVEDVSDRLKDIPGLDVTKELAFLNERGLVFEEDGRYMSLVIV